MISVSKCNYYNYRAYLQTLLTFGDNDASRSMVTQGYSFDLADHFEAFDINAGLIYRNKDFRINRQADGAYDADGAMYTGRISHELITCEKFLPPDTLIEFIFTRSSDDFVICRQAKATEDDTPLTKDFKVFIKEMQILMPVVTLSMNTLHLLKNTLDHTKIPYNYRRTQVVVHNVFKTSSFVTNNLIGVDSGVYPVRIFIVFIENVRKNGTQITSPYYFARRWEFEKSSSFYRMPSVPAVHGDISEIQNQYRQLLDLWTKRDLERRVRRKTLARIKKEKKQRKKERKKEKRKRNLANKKSSSEDVQITATCLQAPIEPTSVDSVPEISQLDPSTSTEFETSLPKRVTRSQKPNVAEGTSSVKDKGKGKGKGKSSKIHITQEELDEAVYDEQHSPWNPPSDMEELASLTESSTSSSELDSDEDLESDLEDQIAEQVEEEARSLYGSAQSHLSRTSSQAGRVPPFNQTGNGQNQLPRVTTKAELRIERIKVTLNAEPLGKNNFNNILTILKMRAI